MKDFANGKYIKIVFWIMFILLSLLFAFLCLYKLGEGPIQDWDEARHGVSAYEIIRNNEWVVTTYGNAIDYWNLKPPLSEWVIAFGYYVFGFTPFGMRIYSAIAMISAALLCSIFLHRCCGKLSALFALLCFSGTGPLLFTHCARTADADSLYILFYTAAVVMLCRYCRKGDASLYCSCLAFSFAFLTKSWHAGCIGILILIYLILSRRIFQFTVINWMLCIASAFGPIMLWTVARMTKDGTAFFEGMLEYDLLKRSSVALEGHVGGAGYYVEFLWSYRIFVILAILAAFAAPLLMDKAKKDMIYVLSLSILIPLVIFSLASTKLNWYILCIFPSLILLASLGVNEIVRGSRKYIIGLLSISVPIFLLLLCIRSNVKAVINTEPGESIANAVFTMASRTEEFSGKRIYKYVIDSGEGWGQSEFLSMELAGDLLPANGGIEMWKADESAYLITRLESVSQLDVENEIVSEDGTYCIVMHKQ